MRVNRAVRLPKIDQLHQMKNTENSRDSVHSFSKVLSISFSHDQRYFRLVIGNVSRIGSFGKSSALIECFGSEL